jgi:hypothetical protein
MLVLIKYIFKYLRKDQPITFWLLVASFIIVVFMVVFVLCTTDASAETFNTCIAKCKMDVMYIDECVEDERSYWETNTPDINLKHACMDLIRNERLNCRSICEYDLASKYSYAPEYYDTHVKGFPATSNH